MNAERYMITARCYPPYAAMAYRGQRLLSRDIMSDSPVRWVIDDNFGAGLTEEEALSRLGSLRSGAVLYEMRPLDTETDRRDSVARTGMRTRESTPETEFVVPGRRADPVAERHAASGAPAASVRRPSGKARRDPGRIYGLKTAAKEFGVAAETAGKWAASWLAPAVVGKEGGTVVLDRTKAEGLVALHRRGKSRSPELPAPKGEGLLFSPKDVAQCLGIAETTVRAYRRMFRPALTVRARRMDDCVWSRAKVGEIWRSHVAAVRENRPAAPEGTVLGNAALARAIGCAKESVGNRLGELKEARIAMYGREWLWDVAKAAEIWSGILRRNEEARRAGISEYFERRRLGLEPLRRKHGMKIQ